MMRHFMPLVFVGSQKYSKLAVRKLLLRWLLARVSTKSVQDIWPGKSICHLCKTTRGSNGNGDRSARRASEVAILADDTCNPAFVAADLLSQAEHGVDSQCLLVATNESIADQVLEEIERQSRQLRKKRDRTSRAREFKRRYRIGPG